MIDAHAHFLPNIDDGAKSVDESLAMLREAYKQGVRLCVATPHAVIHDNDEIHLELLRFINSPQKRIRSLCAVLYFKSIKTEITPQFIDILTIGELIHNASLLHDDVIDGAKTRRGALTIGEKFSPQIAILSGDLLLSFATEKLIKIGDMKIISFFQQCTQKMSEAEIKQYMLRGSMPSIEEYIQIAEGKTASLFDMWWRRNLLRRSGWVLGMRSS